MRSGLTNWSRELINYKDEWWAGEDVIRVRGGSCCLGYLKSEKQISRQGTQANGWALEVDVKRALQIATIHGLGSFPEVALTNSMVPVR